MVLSLIKNVLRKWIVEKRTLEKPSPYPRINYPRKTIEINNKIYKVFTIADTNSMDPVFDKGHKAIAKKHDLNKDLLSVGDVVIYRRHSDNLLISHRIVDIKHYDKGLYFVCKGDNNFYEDPIKVRREDIKYIMVGVLY